jgi:hypothetical protein
MALTIFFNLFFRSERGLPWRRLRAHVVPPPVPIPSTPGAELLLIFRPDFFNFEGCDNTYWISIRVFGY